MFHLAAWSDAVDKDAVLTAVGVVREEMIFTSGYDLRVPDGLANIVGAACLASVAGLQAQVQSPSLRSIANVDVEPIVVALVFGSPPEVLFHPLNPIPLTPDEALNFAVNSDGTTRDYGLVFLSDGALQPVTGNIVTVRCTAAITLAAGVWVNGNLTFGTVLPAGRYQVIGMRARGTNLVAARLVFPEQVARPGVCAVNAIGDLDPTIFRYGRFGVFGEFPHTNPPTLDALGVTDSAQVIYLDLLKVA